jgi:hypothetical protein
VYPFCPCLQSALIQVLYPGQDQEVIQDSIFSLVTLGVDILLELGENWVIELGIGHYSGGDILFNEPLSIFATSSWFDSQPTHSIK